MAYDAEKLLSIKSVSEKKDVSSLQILKACEDGDINNITIDNQVFIMIDEKLDSWSPDKGERKEIIEKRGDITIFHLGSNFNFYQKGEVEKELLAEIDLNRCKFIFQFSKEPNIDSSGIAVLTRAALFTITHQKRVQVINLGEVRKNIFAITKLEKVMDFPEDLAAALKNLED